MDTETAATPADDGPVTLLDAVEAATENQGGQQEAQTQAGDTEGTLDDLAQEALGETPATPEEEIEVEFEGDKRKLPPKWKDAFLREQDYRRKTMDLGEQRRTLETERETVQSVANQLAQDFQANVDLGLMDRQIQELEKADTTGWPPEQVNRGVAALLQLKQSRNALAYDIQSRDQQRTQEAQGARQRCLEEAAARVPNFTDERRTELESLAISTGAEASEVKNLAEPWAYELLHYADIGKKFIERQRKAAQMKAAHAGAPATMLGSAVSGGKSPEDMSMEEYAAWRAAGNG